MKQDGGTNIPTVARSRGLGILALTRPGAYAPGFMLSPAPQADPARLHGRAPNSPGYHLSLDFKPQGKTKDPGVKTVGQYIDAESWLERYDKLGIEKTV